MDHPSRFCFVDNSGNTDYSELHRWSPHLHSGYKSPAPADNSSYIYTSDYGSYSSQESNHSGTTYSNLADCEDALNSPYAAAYDLPPPELYNSMDRRRDKPLPPPRMTSRTQVQSSQRVQPPVAPIRQKKISFDDSTMIKAADSGALNVPSFATLPRKKKLVNSSSTNNVPSAAQSSTQVTWMKEVAQKGDILTKSKSTGTIETNKKPQGILKNKLPLGKTHSDTNGYIKRDTVQKILDQQRKAINRQSSPNQFYKSLSSLPPNHPSERQQPPTQRAWEYTYGDKARSNTATVIGIFEPNTGGDNMRIINHSKQRSDETEFEFPPPPTDQDIAQIMNDPVQESSSSQRYGDSQSNNYGSNSINSTQEQSRGRSRATSSRSTINRSQSQCDKDRRQKPQVPQRPPKHVVNGHTMNTGKAEANRSETLTRPHIRPRGKSCDRMSTERRKAPFDQRISPFKHADNNHNQIVPPPRLQKPQATTLPSKLHNPKEVTTPNTSDLSTDIVLPPPAEFMGSTTHLATNQPSYGDYELLSPEAQYEKCDLHPTMSTQSTTESNYIYNQNAQRTVENGGQNSPRYTPRATYHQKPHVANNSNTYQFNPNYATILVNHRHQYSTEL